MEIEGLVVRDNVTIPVCPFPKGKKAGIRCRNIIVAKMERGGVKRICPVPAGGCVYHG